MLFSIHTNSCIVFVANQEPCLDYSILVPLLFVPALANQVRTLISVLFFRSCFGRISSLNGEPEKGTVVEVGSFVSCLSHSSPSVVRTLPLNSFAKRA